MPLVSDIAEAVKNELNAQAFSLPFTAERHYLPLFELPEMKDLHVTVVPNGITVAALGRDRAQYDCKVDVAVQKKLEGVENAEIDALMALVEEIAERFNRKRLLGMSEAAWVRTENVPIYSHEHLSELRQFTSVITLTFRVAK